MEKFSELIKRNRQLKGLTMRQLEEDLKKTGANNISRSLINLLEKDMRRPSYDVAYQLARILEIDIEEALRAAYRARADHDKKREESYLKKLIVEKEIESLDVKRVMK